MRRSRGVGLRHGKKVWRNHTPGAWHARNAYLFEGKVAAAQMSEDTDEKPFGTRRAKEGVDELATEE